MKRTLVIAFLLLGLGRAEAAEVASVKDVKGEAEIAAGLQRPSAVKSKQRLENGVSLNLPAKGTIELLFYSDGHRELLAGPCLVRLTAAGCQVIHGGSGCLSRSIDQKWTLVLPQGGNLQSVGGRIAGISDPSNAQVHYQRSRPGSSASRAGLPQSAKAQSTTVLADSNSPIPSLELQLNFNQVAATVSFTQSRGSSEGLTFSLKSPAWQRPQTLKDGQIAIATSTLTGGANYFLTVFQGQKLQQRIPFRVLSRAQETELAGLLANQDEGKQALVIERLDQMGLPSLAAQKAEELLGVLQDKDAGLLTYLYKLYRDQLLDGARAAQVRQRALRQNLKLN